MSAGDKHNYYAKFSYMVAYPIVGMPGIIWPIYGSILTIALLFFIPIMNVIRLSLASIFASGIFVNIALLARDLGYWGFGPALCVAAAFLIAAIILPMDRKFTFFRKL